jgi:hypothetical protein
VKPAVEIVEIVEDPQPCPDRSLRIILVGLRVSEIDQHPVPVMLCNMTLILAHHPRAGLLIGADHLMKILGILSFSYGGRVDQVAKHHRDVTPFAFRRQDLGSAGSGIRLGKPRRSPTAETGTTVDAELHIRRVQAVTEGAFDGRLDGGAAVAAEVGVERDLSATRIALHIDSPLGSSPGGKPSDKLFP